MLVSLEKKCICPQGINRYPVLVLVGVERGMLELSAPPQLSKWSRVCTSVAFASSKPLFIFSRRTLFPGFVSASLFFSQERVNGEESFEGNGLRPENRSSSLSAFSDLFDSLWLLVDSALYSCYAFFFASGPEGDCSKGHKPCWQVVTLAENLAFCREITDPNRRPENC